MLSAAHILAMDAKNLLDVVDSIRVRFPDLFSQSYRNPQPSLAVSGVELNHAISNQHSASVSALGDDSYEQTYQNLAECNDSSTGDEIYANQAQILQQNSSIYDNQCMISAQLKTLNVSVAPNYSETETKSNTIPPSKPPVAVKPTNLQQKFKTNLNSVAPATISTSDKSNAASEESLKIVENDQDLYSNTKAAE